MLNSIKTCVKWTASTYGIGYEVMSAVAALWCSVIWLSLIRLKQAIVGGCSWCRWRDVNHNRRATSWRHLCRWDSQRSISRGNNFIDSRRAAGTLHYSLHYVLKPLSLQDHAAQMFCFTWRHWVCFCFCRRAVLRTSWTWATRRRSRATFLKVTSSDFRSTTTTLTNCCHTSSKPSSFWVRRKT